MNQGKTIFAVLLTAMIAQFKKIALPLIIISGMGAFAEAQTFQSCTIWDISESRFFDRTNKAYPIEDGCVIVNLHQQTVRCPTGMGHLASGRKSVKEIQFLFSTLQSGDCWLHITWNPGGSGNEQFEMSCNAVNVGKSALLDAQQKPDQWTAERFKLKLNNGENNVTLRLLSGDGLRFKNIVLCTSDKLPKPNLKYPNLEAYEASIEEPGVMLDSRYVRLFTPGEKTTEAKIIFKYLIKAYDELYRLVGAHAEYKVVVYHFPEGHQGTQGGTVNCEIKYGYKNLDLKSYKEWEKYGLPHVSGYIEEMAHSFVHSTGAQFGWEMIGWTIGTKITEKVASNPIHKRHVLETREIQMHTFKRYQQLGYVFPKDIAANLCDRIHAHILWRCEQKYGPDFWQDFFQEIHKEHARLKPSVSKGGDQARNQRYQITVECFDRLQELNFKDMLEKFQISLTTDVKSLHPMEPRWNRKFIP